MFESQDAYGNFGLNYTTLMSLIAQAKRKFNSLPKEEQERILAEREAREVERQRKTYIQQGLCPECQGKLIRGKKNKQNDYKREWKCTKCDKIHFN